jgi:hypothetical protein
VHERPHCRSEPDVRCVADVQAPPLPKVQPRRRTSGRSADTKAASIRSSPGASARATEEASAAKRKVVTSPPARAGTATLTGAKLAPWEAVIRRRRGGGCATRTGASRRRPGGAAWQAASWSHAPGICAELTGAERSAKLTAVRRWRSLEVAVERMGAASAARWRAARRDGRREACAGTMAAARGAVLSGAIGMRTRAGFARHTSRRSSGCRGVGACRQIWIGATRWLR